MIQPTPYEARRDQLLREAGLNQSNEAFSSVVGTRKSSLVVLSDPLSVYLCELDVAMMVARRCVAAPRFPLFDPRNQSTTYANPR